MFYLKIKKLSDIRQAAQLFEDYIFKSCTQAEIENARLVMHELVTNVIAHSKCAATLHVIIKHNALEITVESDLSCGERAATMPTTCSERGRGLYIVNCLCQKLILEEKKTTALMPIGIDFSL